MEINIKIIGVLIGVCCGLFIAYDKKFGLKRIIITFIADIILVSGFVAYLISNPSYELGTYPNEEHYYLGIEVTPEGDFTYLNKDFTTETVKIDLDKALIAGRINTIGFNNRYKKYKMVGPLKIYWDSHEDMVMLSKFTAIQLGLIEATGAEDEKEFIIATGSNAEELLNPAQ